MKKKFTAEQVKNLVENNEIDYINSGYFCG